MIDNTLFLKNEEREERVKKCRFPKEKVFFTVRNLHCDFLRHTLDNVLIIMKLLQTATGSLGNPESTTSMNSVGNRAELFKWF